jgi:hypothetical protein
LEYRAGLFLYRDIYYGASSSSARRLYHADQRCSQWLTPGGCWMARCRWVMSERGAAPSAIARFAARALIKTVITATRTESRHGGALLGYEVIAYQGRPIYELRYRVG